MAWRRRPVVDRGLLPCALGLREGLTTDLAAGFHSDFGRGVAWRARSGPPPTAPRALFRPSMRGDGLTCGPPGPPYDVVVGEGRVSLRDTGRRCPDLGKHRGGVCGVVVHDRRLRTGREYDPDPR